MSDEARVLLDMATLAEVEGQTVSARRLREASTHIENLDKRIDSLEEGECRFHCRMRKDMWGAGFIWAMQYFNFADGVDVGVQYIKWRNEHDRDT